MNEILTLVTFLALLFYTGIEMKFQLQMLQQNSYRNDRYNRWLKGESFATVSRLTDLFLLLLLSTNFLPTFVQIVTITVSLIGDSYLSPLFHDDCQHHHATCREANQPKILRRSETNSLPNARLNCHRHYRELWKNQYQALPLPHTLRAIQRVNDSRQF